MTAIPNGNAVGTTYSGTVRAIVTTTACSGACGPVEVIEKLPTSYCDVGESVEQTFTLTQNDGEIAIDRLDLSFPMAAKGGVDRDGTIDVGGFATHLAGTMRGATRLRGKLTPTEQRPFDWTLEGVAMAHTHGAVRGVAVDCVATSEVKPKAR